MNICLLGQFPPHIGGVASHSQMLARKLAGRGDNVYVLTYPHTDIRDQDEITIKTAFTINIKGLRGFIFFLSSLFQLLNIVRKYDIEVIHAHFLIPPGLVAVLVGGITHRKVVVTVHGSDIFILTRNTLLKILIKYVLKKADIIAVVNEDIRDQILKLDISGVPDKIRLTPNAVDLEKFKPTNKSALFKEIGIHQKPVVLFVGNLVDQKGLNYLLDAKKEMETPSALVIVGDGPLMKKLQEQVKRDGINDVYFTGARRDVEQIMPGADLFVLPSLSEGSPISILEAFASGLPAVATNLGGVKELITPDVGLIVPSKDHTSLKEAMDKILKDKELKKKMAQ
ncbi:MAG: glycosyltransferase, partial [Methanobacterium sp.]|nr:glycosyltransferase [Methanobacterium sp.]